MCFYTTHAFCYGAMELRGREFLAFLVSMVAFSWTERPH